MDDHGIGIGDIQPCLDNGGGYKHINFPIDEISHDPLQFMLPHLSVGKCNHGLRYQGLDSVCHLVNIRHPVVYIIHLSVPGQLAVNGFPDHLLIVFHHIRLNRGTVHRRFLQHTHVPDSRQTHVQGPWNGGCG